MRKNVIVICAVAMLLFAVTTAPVMADIVNGGFESGDFTGWTTSVGGQFSVTSVGTDPRTNNALSTVGNGTHSARVGDPVAPLLDGNYNDPFTLQQTWVKTSDFSHLYFNWAAVALVPGANAVPHTDAQTAWFQIKVLNLTGATTLFSQEYYTGTVDSGVVAGWIAGSTDTTGYSNDPGVWYYRPWQQFDLDLSTVADGDNLQVMLSTRDCTLGGHASYAYLDGFGRTPDPVQTPEPTTLLLLACGLIGIYRMRQKM